MTPATPSATLLLACAALAAASPSCDVRSPMGGARPRLLSLRGGAGTPIRRSRHSLLSLRGGASSYPTPVRYSYSESGTVQPMRAPSSPMPLTRQEPDTMSDAEKIQVLQQFQRPAVRMAFLRKVYGIVTAQLVLTALVVYALRTVPGLLPSIVRRLGVSIGLLPILPLALLSFGQSAGGVLAYALLVLFTATEALAVGAFTWAIPTAVLMRAAGATAVATGGLSLYALNTRRDFTMMGGMLFSCLLGLLSLGVLQLIFGGSYLLAMRSSLGLVVFCAYLVVNTQMMMGGNKKRQVRPTEHIMAAITLYTDIINIFMHLVAAMARDNRD